MEADINDDYLRPFKSRKWGEAVDNHELVNLLKVYFTGQELWNPQRPQILDTHVKARLTSQFANLSELVKLDFFCCYPYFEYHKNRSQHYILCTISDLLFEDIDEYVACLAEEFKMKLLDVEIDEAVYARKTKHCEIICANICNVPNSYMSAIDKITDALNTVRGEVEFERDAAEKIHQLLSANSQNFNMMDEDLMDCSEGLPFGQNNMQWQLPKNELFEEVEISEGMRLMEQGKIVEKVVVTPEQFYQQTQRNVHTGVYQHHQAVRKVPTEPTMNDGYQNNKNSHVANPGPAPIVYNVESDDDEIDAANFFVKYSDLPPKPAPPSTEKPVIRNFNNNLIALQSKFQRPPKSVSVAHPIHKHYADVIPLPKHPNRNPEPLLPPAPILEKKQVSPSQRKLVQEKDEQIARRNAKEEQKKPEADMARIFEIIAQEAENYRLGLEMEARNYPSLNGDGSKGESFNLLHETHNKKKPGKKRDYRAEALRRKARGDLVHTRAPGGGFEVLLDGNGVPVRRTPTINRRAQTPVKPQTPPVCLGPAPISFVEKQKVETTTTTPQQTIPNGDAKKFIPSPKNDPDVTVIGEVRASPKIPIVPRRRAIRKTVGPRTKAPPLAVEQLRVMSAKRVITISKVDAEAISAGKKSLLLRPYVDENGVESYRVVTEDVRKINTGPRNRRTRKSSLVKAPLKSPQDIHLGTKEPAATTVACQQIPNIQPCLFETPPVEKPIEMLEIAEQLRPVCVATIEKTEPLHCFDPVQNSAHCEELGCTNNNTPVKELEMKTDGQVLEDIAEDDLFSNMDFGSEFSADGIFKDIMQMPMWPENYVDNSQSLDLAAPFEEGIANEKFEEPIEEKLFENIALPEPPTIQNKTAMVHYRVTPEEYAQAELSAPDIFGKPAKSPEELEDRYLMISFLSGRLENPHPERGNVFSVRLSQKTDTVIYKHSETRIVIEQHFEMNFAEMEWGRVRKTITHKQGKVLEKTEYISVLDL